MEASIKKQEKELAKKEEELQALKNPSFEPLQPFEMVDAIIYSPYRQYSLKEILIKLESLTEESFADQELIDVPNSLISISIIEPLKSKIDVRQDVLEKRRKNYH